MLAILEIVYDNRNCYKLNTDNHRNGSRFYVKFPLVLCFLMEALAICPRPPCALNKNRNNTNNKKTLSPYISTFFLLYTSKKV